MLTRAALPTGGATRFASGGGCGSIRSDPYCPLSATVAAGTTGRVTAHTAVSTLRIVRTARGLTQERLALLAGLSRSTVSRVETGIEVPSLRTVRRLAAVLDWPAADLFPLDDRERRARQPMPRVVALHRERGRVKRTDSWAEHQRGVVYTLRDGKISRYEEHQTKAEALEAVGLRE